MKFNKITTSGKNNYIGLTVKLALGLLIILGIIFSLNKIDFPAQKKTIEKIISNENFKIVK